MQSIMRKLFAVILALAIMCEAFGLPHVSSAEAISSTCNNLVVNGSFETGTSPWQATDWGAGRSSARSYDGYWSYYVGSITPFRAAYVRQWMMIPSRASVGRITFAAQVVSLDSSIYAYDRLHILLTDVDSNILVDFGDLDNTSARYWQPHEANLVDLSAASGKFVYLVFAAENNASLLTLFYIDAIGLCYYELPAPTPTRTPTPPTNVTVQSAWTTDGNDNPTTNFAVGDTIGLHANVNNSGTSPVTAFFDWETWDSSGSPVSDLSHSGNDTTGPGVDDWALHGPIPLNSPTGFYTFQASVTYNGQPSSQSTQFYVQGATPTPSQTQTSVPTATNTPSQTVTPTWTPTATDTPTLTPTRTVTNTPASTPSDTATPTQTATPTATDTVTTTATATQTNTPTSTARPTDTPTPTPRRVWLPVIMAEGP
jgi:hypothetical protein